MEKLYIIIPAYNEEETIEQVIQEWHRIVKGIGSESRLIVIDDGSWDNTYEKLCSLKCELQQLEILRKDNSGHGDTILYGYIYAVNNEADFVFQTDSDGQTLASEFKMFWEKRYEATAIIGFRNHREDGFSRMVVTKVLKIVLKIIFRLDIPDANAPFRLMKRNALEKYLVQLPEHFNLTNVMLTVLFLANNEKVEFIPITFKKRQGGVNSLNIKKIVQIGIRAVKDFRDIKKKM